MSLKSSYSVGWLICGVSIGIYKTIIENWKFIWIFQGDWKSTKY